MIATNFTELRSGFWDLGILGIRHWDDSDDEKPWNLTELRMTDGTAPQLPVDPLLYLLKVLKLYFFLNFTRTLTPSDTQKICP